MYTSKGAVKPTVRCIIAEHTLATSYWHFARDFIYLSVYPLRTFIRKQTNAKVLFGLIRFLKMFHVLLTD
jgi:hypothetical protein